MKNIFFALSFIAFALTANSQENKPEILKGPANWEFERFSLPPSFAPQITYKGFEELRFAPGMFNKDTSTYFTYAFVAQLDTLVNIREKEIRNYLEYYFKGLCGSTVRERKLTIDSTKISARVTKTRERVPGMYNATVNVFGVFADGAPVTLNMAIHVANYPIDKKTRIIFLASPQGYNEPIWKDLYDIRRNVVQGLYK